MSNFNNASLIVTPNSYKAGKLYSIKPTNGAGDLDVVRATSATRVNSAGLIESVGANIPRLDYTNSSCPSTLVEPQRTNLRTYSNDFNQPLWNKTAIIMTYNSEISPDGTLNASLISTGVDASSGRHRLVQSINYTSGTTYTGTFFLKKANHRWIQICAVTGFLTDVWANFDLENGVIGNTGGVGTTAKIENYGNGWYRCSITGVASSTGSFTGIEIVTTNNTNSGRYLNYQSLVPEDVCYVWGAQLEVGSNATSYIPTTTATVTRNADVISKSGISSLIGQTEGSVLLNFFYPNNITNIIELFNVWNSSTNYLIRCRINSTGINVLSIFYLSVLGVSRMLTNTITLTPNSTNKICIVYNYATNTTKLFANGVLISSTVGVEPYPTNTQDKIGIGNWFGVSNTSIFNNIGIWKTQLSDAEAIQLTTL